MKKSEKNDEKKPPVIRDDIPRVALLIETSREVGRALLRGVENYIRLHGPWAVHVWPGDLLQHLPDMKSWRGTGIIARIMYPEVEQTVLKSGLPTVAIDLYDEQKEPNGICRGLSEVFVDTYHVGRMGAEHFLEKGFSNFAFVGEVKNVSWSRHREKGFCDRLNEAGFPCYRYKAPGRHTQNWGKELHRLGNWLLSLPKPIGLMAAMDIRGRQVIEACQYYGIRVPEEIGILGVDNDQVVCRLCDPPMSSIELDAEAGGFQAAAILDNLMRHVEKNDRTPHEIRRHPIKPLQVVQRRSTERRSISDSLVTEAIRFIKINAAHPLSVSMVVRHVDVSRRTMELRFKRQVGHSVLDEINMARVERVKSFLIETDMTIAEIAETCRFDSETYLYRFFRRMTGETMNSFRRENRKK